MKKYFNITGVCFPHLHYMMDTTEKERQVMHMVEKGDYFVIARPRQYGKTTLLYLLSERLKRENPYLPISLNFQTVSEKWLTSVEAFSQLVFKLIGQYLELNEPEAYQIWIHPEEEVIDVESLSIAISRSFRKMGKKVVLMIDEVDASSRIDPFLAFLGMLRTKYMNRFSKGSETFHSVILAGVHDIKNLKTHIRSTNEARFNSPWNIAANFEVRMSFIPEEIVPMLEAYQKAEEVSFDAQQIADRIFYFTSGYPFLISNLCKIMAEKILPTKSVRSWESQDVELAVQLLLKETNTNFDHLIKNLEGEKELYEVVFRLIIEGENIPFNSYNPILAQGFQYGLFYANHTISIQNRIYEQLIFDYMISKITTERLFLTDLKEYHSVIPQQLDLKNVLIRFQHFMKEQFSRKQTDFLEKQWQLVFLAYLTPIINGKGYAFKEVQTSQEKRLDVVITFMNERYIVELKRWYGPQAHKHGLAQLADYLDIHGVDEGYLLIFDQRKEKEWKQEEVVYQEKRIFAVWV